MRKELFRIIDANLNRSREGLRVCEKITRFVLNSPPLTGKLKAVRHKITGMRKHIQTNVNCLNEARDSRNDVGRCSCHPKEMTRTGYADIFEANIERVKESIRVLEEFFKLIDKKSSVTFSKLRFEVYDIEKRTMKSLRTRTN